MTLVDTKSGDNYTLLSGHPASRYQAAVFEHFRLGRGSRSVIAVAGAGKTTTIKNAIQYLPDRAHVQLLAFNVEATEQLKAAIEELRIKTGRSFARVRANSFHSLGMGAVRKFLNLPNAQITVDANKSRKLLRLAVGDGLLSQKGYDTYGAFAAKLVAYAKGEGLGALIPDTEERWMGLVDHHGLYLDTEDGNERDGVALARRLLEWSNAAAREGNLDYDDQLYLVCLWRLRLWRNDVVIADEVQDTNPVRRAILHLALKDGGRLYAVGDPAQSIYGFTGATPDAMDLIAKEFKTATLPLTVSYRCARRIVERAQVWVPEIESAPGAPEGRVDDDMPLKQALAVLTSADAVLCRRNAPLVKLAYGLLSRGRACRILGREIGEGLAHLVEQQKARGLDRLIEKLEAWRDKEAAKFIAKGQETRAEGVIDRVDCIMAIAVALPVKERTVPALLNQLRAMFADPARGEVQQILTLATVHKAKGKEWDRVAILRPDLMPSRAARQAWQEEQEFNLMYVAATRAKEHLIYCAEKDEAI